MRKLHPLPAILALLLVHTCTGCWYVQGDEPAVRDDGTIVVRTGGQLQKALDAAQPGDTIELEAGAEFKGNFLLPVKTGEEWITLRSSAHASLPPKDTRVSPADAPHMPKIVSPDSRPALAAEYGAHHWRFVGLEITTPVATNYNLITFGFNGLGSRNATSIDQLPHHVVFRQCYIHGNPKGNIRRGLAANGAFISVLDCYLSDFHEVGADSQAICTWNGSGPFKIVNNYLEAAGENIMFGGGPVDIPGLVPSEIEFRGNHCAKPNRWRKGHPEYAGIFWSVKNLLELKNAKRMLIEGNIFENNWIGGQHGFAIVLTPRGDGTAVQDILIRKNIIRHAGAGVHLMSGDRSPKTGGTTLQTRNIRIENNLLYDINQTYDGRGCFVLLMGYAGLPPAENVKVQNNTFFQQGDAKCFLAMGDSGKVAKNFVFTRNIVTNGLWGIHGTDAEVGEGSLAQYMDGYRVERNVIIGATNRRLYPPNNRLVASARGGGFADDASGGFRQTGSSPITKGSAGANLDAIRTATAGVIDGKSH